MSASCRILFIGMDGAEADLLTKWEEAGVMPNLQRLRERGAWAIRPNPLGLGNDATWAVISTGLNPGKLGRYFVRQVWPGTYAAVKFRAADVKVEPFWIHASRAGKRVAIIDMPYASVAEDLNGFQLADWLVHGPLYDHKLHTYPASFAAEVSARFGTDPVGSSDRPGRRNLAQNQSLREGLLQKTKLKADFACHYLGEGGWDLFMVTFTDVHCIGHTCWHLHDPAHPLYDAAIVEAMGDVVKDLYVAFDVALGRLLDCVGPETTVVMFTGPGMRANYSPSYLLDAVLRHLENGPETRDRRIMKPLRKSYRRLAPPALRARLRKLSDWVNERSLVADRKRRKCFAVPSNEIAGAIRVNLVGREPNGRVHRGAEYDAFFEELRRDLLEVVNLDTGKPIAKDVLRADKLYHGRYLDDLPDILVIWARDAPVSAIGSPKVGTVRGEYPGNRTGDHTPDFFFLAQGPGIRPGEIGQPVTAMDIAPTMAAMLGVSLPETDGASIASLCLGKERVVEEVAV